MARNRGYKGDEKSSFILPTETQSKETEIPSAPAIIEIEMPVLASDENRQTDAEILQKQKEIKQLEQKIAVETDGILQNGYYSELLRKQEQLIELEKIKNQTLLPTNPTVEEVAWALSTWAAPGYIMTEAEKKQARKLFGNGMYPGIDRESITEEDAINLAYAYSKSNPIQNFMLGVSDNALFHLLSDTFEKYGDMPQLEYETPSMEQMTDNAYIQQPVVTTAGKLTGSVAEFAIFSKLIQLIPGVGAAAEKGGQLVGNTITSLMNKLKIKGAEEAGKLVTTKATEILSDTTVDIALDTVPNLTENIKNGLPVEETLRNAAQSIGTNLGYNLAGTVILHGLNKAVSGSGVKGGADASFTWKLRGEDVTLNDVKVQEISYVKRNSTELKTLRDEFNTTTRKAFLEDLGKNTEYLRNAGFSETDILKIQNGRVPDGWQVHHKLPLDDSGTNSFDNLVLIQNEPYHKVITNYQNSIARQMEIGEVQAVQWPMPNGNIYPAQH